MSGGKQACIDVLYVFFRSAAKFIWDLKSQKILEISESINVYNIFGVFKNKIVVITSMTPAIIS